MDGKRIRVIGMGCVALLWLLLTAGAWLAPEKEISVSERRRLAQMPELSYGNVLSGDFMADFEDYALDQFPMRDRFRRWKALAHYYAFGQRDNNGIYLTGDGAAKLEYPLNEASVDRAVGIFNRVWQQRLRGTQCRIYFAMVPDKGYYLAPRYGYPVMDYAVLAEKLRQGIPWATPIDLTDCLTGADYYRTDTHWRQECLIMAADRICKAMAAETTAGQTYTVRTAPAAFYGVYYGQAALPMAPDRLRYLESPVLELCRVYHYETGKTTAVYDLEKLQSPDRYDLFMSGPSALQRIENPQGTPGRELVVFRDSFGSSLVPLLVQGYSRITLVDLRYLSPAVLEQQLEFRNQDVLFLYSTLVLNQSAGLKG